MEDFVFIATIIFWIMFGLWSKKKDAGNTVLKVGYLVMAIWGTWFSLIAMGYVSRYY